MFKNLWDRLCGRTIIHDTQGQRFVLGKDRCWDDYYYAKKVDVRVAVATYSWFNVYYTDVTKPYPNECWANNDYLTEGRLRLGCHKFGSEESDVIRRWLA